ncbi:MAG: pantoate--beta-alanine ligase [Deltaproteobacteria bacterium]|nr:MAG: pantoate--beta-alanine ligase [Deltaproteobacteria bacterium]
MLPIVQPAEVTEWVEAERAAGRRIGFVPTMGYLHEGHRSLMRLLRPKVDRLVVSIYVNPLQFGANEDFTSYPRDPEGDAQACRAEGVDVLFSPTELYPPGFATRISVPALDQTLCSVRRPHFFTGVATAVHRLFRIVRPHFAAFGEKDFQQLAVIRRMVSDLAMSVEIVGGPVVREADGLAMSSRNAYLSSAQRVRAVSLSRALVAMQGAALKGEAQGVALRALGRSILDVDELDYLSIIDPSTLQPVERLTARARVVVAAYVGKTRLIDNMPIGVD